jgi:hypothetical protein
MPVFESTCSDIFERDPAEDPLHMSRVANRHSTVSTDMDHDQLFDYILLLLESEELLTQYRAIRSLQSSLRDWIRRDLAILSPSPPRAVSPDDSNGNEPFDGDLSDTSDSEDGDSEE